MVGQVIGVRCVRVIAPTNLEGPGLAWYGEGRRNGGRYRHIAVVRQTFDGRSYVGVAADLHNNGEDYNNFSAALRVVLFPNQPPVAYVDPWNETWHEVATTSYTSVFSAAERVTDCGPLFHAGNPHLAKFRVYSAEANALRGGNGVRCAVRRLPAANPTVQGEFDYDVWYGAGRIYQRDQEENPVPSTAERGWRSRSYAHLGTRRADGVGLHDLCQGQSFCQAYDEGSLFVSRTTLSSGTSYRVTGLGSRPADAERWLPATRRHSLRVLVVSTCDDDGSYCPYPAAAKARLVADVGAYVARANQIFATPWRGGVDDRVLPASVREFS